MTAQKLNAFSLSELLKRVPPNQIEKFKRFRQQTLDYHRRVNKYADKLPAIDWEYYRKNVREDYAKMIDQFQIKYEELNHSFSRRHEALDHSKYYTEWEEINAQVHEEVKKYIEDSVKRVKAYEEELERIKDLKYENMTMEQFVVLREDIAYLVPGQGKELFWPHTPEEQLGYENRDYKASKDENQPSPQRVHD